MENKTELVENPELNAYIKELNDDVNVTLANLREKSLMMSAIKAKWLAYYMKEKENFQRIQNLKTKIIKNKSSGAQGSVLRLKTEETISQNDEKIQQLNQLMTKTKENLDFLERAMNILNDFVWQIRNSIEVLKLQNS